MFIIFLFQVRQFVNVFSIVVFTMRQSTVRRTESLSCNITLVRVPVYYCRNAFVSVLVLEGFPYKGRVIFLSLMTLNLSDILCVSCVSFIILCSLMYFPPSFALSRTQYLSLFIFCFGQSSLFISSLCFN